MRLKKQLFLYILFVIVAFLGITSQGVTVEVLRVETLAKEICVIQNDGTNQLVLECGLPVATTAAINPRGSQRIGGSRPTRLLPQGSGNRAHGKWLSVNSFNLSQTINPFLRHVLLNSKGGAASPRFYYVIALRRILC